MGLLSAYKGLKLGIRSIVVGMRLCLLSAYKGLKLSLYLSLSIKISSLLSAYKGLKQLPTPGFLPHTQPVY